MPIEFRRNLPHIYADDAIYDINFRLVNTIPSSIFKHYNELKDYLIMTKTEYDDMDLYDQNIDKYLNNSSNYKQWLSIEKIRNIVASSIQFNHKQLYEIIVYCIMPNHVHLIINTLNYPYKPLGEILKSIKQFSATESNKFLNRKGQFWHHESFDHIIRSRNELSERIKYVTNNPVKANLVKDCNNWPGTYVDSKFLENL